MEAAKNGDKARQSQYKLMSNAAYRKTMENLRNRINVKLVNSKKDYLKYTSKPSYLSQKIFDINLVAIRKSKAALEVNKPAYILMCIFELSKCQCTNSIMITSKIREDIRPIINRN